MRPWLRRAALMSALSISCLALALELAAGQLAALRDAAATQDDITGSIGSSRHYLALTEEQRGHIFDGVMRLANTPVADMPAPAVSVPGTVALQDLPSSVTRDLPIVDGYKFVKLDDRILLVSPADRAVVAEMPRYKMIVD